MSEKYLKLKCSKCFKWEFVKEEDIPTKFNCGNIILDEEHFVCEKCEKEIDKKRMLTCIKCEKEFKPTNKDDYSKLCDNCYDFIMNDYEPKGKVKELFEILLSSDIFVSWEDLAIMKYKICEVFKPKQKK